MTIDWRTLALQTINVLILIWLLRTFFWQPVAAMIEQRRVSATALLDAGREQSGARRRLVSRTSKKPARALPRNAKSILATAQVEAEQARAVKAEETGKAMQAMEAAARMRMDAEGAATEAAWRHDAAELAIEIAGRLAARLNGGLVRAAFLDWLLKDIASLPASVRRDVAAGENTLELVCATPLESAEQEHHAKLIAQAFGGSPKISFKTESSLIAGMELRSHNFLLRNSWRADLDHILEGIANEQ